MKSLLIYATNSGSTLEVSNNIVSAFAQKGLEIILKDAREVEPSELNDYDLIIFGSPTWGEGDPHDSFLALFDKFGENPLPKKKYAVFGLGDSSYSHFCGAADHLEEFIKKHQGELVVYTLKINNYYFNQAEELPNLEEWTQKLTSLSS